jgi:hypothetical protein
MYKGIVPDGNIVAYNCFCTPIGTMDHGAILYIHFISDADAVNITTKYGIEPNAALIPHNNIPNNGGIGGYETIISPFGSNIFYW